VLLYLLRGFGLITFIPGGIIVVPLLVSLILGIIWGVEKTKE
jgi:hypothetical protein